MLQALTPLLTPPSTQRAETSSKHQQDNRLIKLILGRTATLRNGTDVGGLWLRGRGFEPRRLPPQFAGKTRGAASRPGLVYCTRTAHPPSFSRPSLLTVARSSPRPMDFGSTSLAPAPRALCNDIGPLHIPASWRSVPGVPYPPGTMLRGEHRGGGSTSLTTAIVSITAWTSENPLRPKFRECALHALR